jgi:iron complex transport system substrate-binding protein
MPRRISALLAFTAVALAPLLNAPAAAAAPQGGDFPVTVQAGNGKVTIDAKPGRIVSLSPTATEMLFAIGAGDQVVAVDDQSDYPEGVPTTDLSGFEPNAEAVAGYDPDLVVMSDGAIADTLEQLDIPVIVDPSVKRLKGSYRQIRQLGEATGHEQEAEDVVDDMKAEIAALRGQVTEQADEPTAYYELEDTYFSVTSDTFIGQVLSQAGLANIADEADDSSDYPQLSAEYIVDSDPDYIFLADTECCGQSADTVAARPGWADIAAVRGGQVVTLDDDIASRWGPRVVDLLQTIVQSTTQ